MQQVAQLDFALELGTTTESVDFTADASQGLVINNKRIVDMPLNGRNSMHLGGKRGLCPASLFDSVFPTLLGD